MPEPVRGLVLAVVLACVHCSLLRAAGSDLDEAIRKARMGTLVVDGVASHFGLGRGGHCANPA